MNKRLVGACLSLARDTHAARSRIRVFDLRPASAPVGMHRSSSCPPWLRRRRRFTLR
jgi:hypothetical protein